MNVMNEMKVQDRLWNLAVAQAKLNKTTSQKSIHELYFKLVDIRKATLKKLAERKSQSGLFFLHYFLYSIV